MDFLESGIIANSLDTKNDLIKNSKIYFDILKDLVKLIAKESAI